MRKISVAAAAFVAISAFCAPVSAATIISNNGNLAEVIHGASNGTTTGTSLTLDSKNSGFLIQYSSSDVLSVTGNGVAQVTGNSGGFSDLQITPLSNITFTSFQFNLDIPKAAQSTKSFDNTEFSFTTKLYFTSGLPQTFTGVDAGAGNGSNRYLITADLGQYINKIVLSALVSKSYNDGTPGNVTTLSYDFDAIKQASFNFAAGAGVPEPATWAEFILGFGAIGVALRRRRSLVTALPA